MRPWAQEHHEVFERDVLLDFCGASDLLFDQFERLEASGSVSFPVLRGMVGEPRNKGMLWRLKDKAHHIFAGEKQPGSEGLLLDWTLGSLFHESLKLMEDAHQRQFYAPRLEEIRAVPGIDPATAAEAMALGAIAEETHAGLRNGARRLDALLGRGRALFALYFKGKARHRPLARFLYDQNALARRAFKEDYPAFVNAVYGGEPERLYLEAARSLLESARDSDADEALREALALKPDNAEALALQKERAR